MNKYYISANELLADSFKLAQKIHHDNFLPDFIVGVWRGGAPIGIAIQEYFDYRHCTCDHIAIRASSYSGINQQQAKVKVEGLEYVLDNMTVNNKVLLVDDVFDSGRSIDAILAKLSSALGEKMPTDIRVACPWFKPDNNKTKRTPDYYLHTTSDWLVFPHELKGLSADDIRQNKPEISPFLEVAPVLIDNNKND